MIIVVVVVTPHLHLKHPASLYPKVTPSRAWAPLLPGLTPRQSQGVLRWSLGEFHGGSCTWVLDGPHGTLSRTPQKIPRAPRTHLGPLRTPDTTGTPMVLLPDPSGTPWNFPGPSQEAQECLRIAP